MILWLDDCLPINSFQRQCQWMLRYLYKPFSMLVMDFAARFKINQATPNNASSRRSKVIVERRHAHHHYPIDAR